MLVFSYARAATDGENHEMLNAHLGGGCSKTRPHHTLSFTEDITQFTFPVVFVIMSSIRAVRRLLQQTSEVASSDPLSEKEQLQIQKQQRRRKLAKQVKTPVDEKEVVKHHLNFLLMMDGAMASSRSKKKMTESRLHETLVNAKERASHCATKVLGNSRSSSSTVTHKKGPPTFNKKRHQKRKEEKSLAKITQLLKKAKAKNNQKAL